MTLSVLFQFPHHCYTFPIMAKKPPNEVSIGKFDILATYVYAQALLHGLEDDEAKQRGMVAAIMGAQARLGVRK
jgi:hypothetical protein